MKTDLREGAWLRCLGYCEKCGLPLGMEFAIHHRKLRSQGGKDAMENVLALHHKCHNLGTDSVHLNPAKSYEMGYMVKSYQNPADVPVTLPDGSTVILGWEGNYIPIGRDDVEST